jgi:hypothetical protein
MIKVFMLTFLAILVVTPVISASSSLDPWRVPHGYTTREASTEEIISEIKNRIIYTRIKDRCYAVIPFAGGHSTRQLSFTQINCTEDVK